MLRAAQETQQAKQRQQRQNVADTIVIIFTLAFMVWCVSLLVRQRSE
jgi:hypothetical protein